MIHIITKPKPRSVYNRGKTDFFGCFVVVDGEIDVFTVLTSEVLDDSVGIIAVSSETIENVFCLVLINSVVSINDGRASIVDIGCVEDDSSATIIELTTDEMVDITYEAVKIVNDEYLMQAVFIVLALILTDDC